MAFERRLLLGDPDWSMRTAADRNTLPRKKGDGGVPLSGSESEYYDRGPGPPQPLQCVLQMHYDSCLNLVPNISNYCRVAENQFLLNFRLT